MRLPAGKRCLNAASTYGSIGANQFSAWSRAIGTWTPAIEKTSGIWPLLTASWSDLPRSGGLYWVYSTVTPGFSFEKSAHICLWSGAIGRKWSHHLMVTG